VQIRTETPVDREAIAAVTAAAFGKEREARIVEAIRRSDRFVPDLSLVAEQDGEIVGHAMLSYVDLAGRRVLELGPMSVAPARQRHGIRSELIGEALRRAEERGEPLILVLGHPSYHPRFGFRRASKLGIEAPVPAFPDDAFMVLPLRSYESSLRGGVILPAAFG
jgi:putative acetyltransferase